MLRKIYLVLLQILIKIGSVQGLIFFRKILSSIYTTFLVVQKKIMSFLISSIKTKIITSKTFSWHKNSISSEKFSKKVIIFIKVMLLDVMTL